MTKVLYGFLMKHHKRQRQFWKLMTVSERLCVCVCVCVRARVHSVAQSCLTRCNLMDCSPLDSSVHGILQARILELVAYFSPGVPESSSSSQGISLKG